MGGKNLPQKVKNDGIDDPVRHRVLFVEEYSQENGVGTTVLHLGYF
jgi:hypothetical protein